MIDLAYYASVFMLGFRGIEYLGVKIADLFILLVFFLFLYRVMKGDRIRGDKLFSFFYILIVISVLLSLLHVDDFTFAKLDPFRYLLVGMFSVATIHYVDSKRRLENTFRVLVLSGLIAAVISLLVFSLWISGFEGVAPFLHRIETGETEGRVQALFYDPNHFGGFLILPVFSLLYFILSSLNEGNRAKTLLSYSGTILLGAALVTTGSRSAVGSVVVGWGAVAAFYTARSVRRGLRNDGAKSLLKVIILSSLIVALILLWFGYSEVEFITRLAGAKNDSTGTGPRSRGPRHGSVKTGLQSRLQLWHAALLAFQDSPIIGVGTSDFIHEYPTLAKEHGFDPTIVNFPHNTFLDLLAELGLIGFLSSLGLLSYLYFIIYRMIRGSPDPVFALTLFSLLLAQSADMFFISMFHGRRLWLVFALITAAGLLVVKSSSSGSGRLGDLG